MAEARIMPGHGIVVTETDGEAKLVPGHAIHAEEAAPVGGGAGIRNPLGGPMVLRNPLGA